MRKNILMHDDSVVKNIWIHIPIIPKCLKMQILALVVFLILLSISCYASLFYLLVWAIYTFLRIHSRKKKVLETFAWIPHNATIVSKQRRKGSPFAVTPYYPYVMDIKYAYEFDGQQYLSNNYAIESCMEPSINFPYSNKEADDILKALKNGHNTKIFINPAKPSEAVMKQGISPANSPSYITAIVGFMVPIMVLVTKCASI